jgi:hypothetical protein
MQLLNPIWLWGFLGLSIPIAIHLLSRKEGSVVKIGSVRHLEDTTTRRFKSIRPNELFLLLLRCILIAILVLFLSGLNFPWLQKKSNWLLIEKGLEKESEFTAIIDSLEKSDYEIKYLTKGFPEVSDSVSNLNNPGYWSLLKKLETQPIQHAVVLSYNYAERFNGRRTHLPENVRWLSKLPDSVEFPLNAVQISIDSMTARIGKSGPEKTKYSFKSTRNEQASVFNNQSLSAEPSSNTSITIVNDPSFEQDKNVVVAALKAIDKIYPDSFIIKSFAAATYQPDTTSDWVITLSENPKFIKDTKSIAYKNAFHKEGLFQREPSEGQYDTWTLTQRLTPDVALQQNLAIRLAALLMPEEKYAQRARQFDKRVLPDELLWDSKTLSVKSPQFDDVTANQKYLFGFFLFFLLLERWVAFKRRQ